MSTIGTTGQLRNEAVRKRLFTIYPLAVVALHCTIFTIYPLFCAAFTEWP